MAGNEAVVDYVTQNTGRKPKNFTEFRDQVKDLHTNGVAMGAAGPFALLSTFFSSSCVLMYRGIRSGITWIERKVHRTV
jgi:hypothetical protein